MQYCDYVRDGNTISENSAKILGFTKIITSKDGVDIISEPARVGSEAKKIILEGRSGFIMKYINDKRVVGVIIDDFEADKSLIEHARHKDKILIINAGKITNGGENYRSKNSIRASELLKNALHYKVKTAIASTARNANEVLSALQLFELARMLGANEEQAKKMLSSMVEIA